MGFMFRTLRSTHSEVTSTLPSPMHTHIDIGSVTIQHDGQKGNNADIKRKGAQLTCPALPDPKQEADLYVHPFAGS